MKSKSPSAASGKSTPKARPTLLLLAAATASIALAACYVPPGGSQFGPSAPNANTHATLPTGAVHTFALTTPNPSWQLAPHLLYRTGENSYLCIHRLTQREGFAAQVISTAEDRFSFRHAGDADPTISHFVLGKTWNWQGQPDVTFIDSIDELKDALADAEAVPFTVAQP